MAVSGFSSHNFSKSDTDTAPFGACTFITLPRQKSPVRGWDTAIRSSKVNAIGLFISLSWYVLFPSSSWADALTGSQKETANVTVVTASFSLHNHFITAAVSKPNQTEYFLSKRDNGKKLIYRNYKSWLPDYHPHPIPAQQIFNEPSNRLSNASSEQTTPASDRHNLLKPHLHRVTLPLHLSSLFLKCKEYLCPRSRNLNKSLTIPCKPPVSNSRHAARISEVIFHLSEPFRRPTHLAPLHPDWRGHQPACFHPAPHPHRMPGPSHPHLLASHVFAISRNHRFHLTGPTWDNMRSPFLTDIGLFLKQNKFIGRKVKHIPLIPDISFCINVCL